MFSERSFFCIGLIIINMLDNRTSGDPDYGIAPSDAHGSTFNDPMAMKDMSSAERRAGVNMGYTVSYLLVMALGTF